MTRFSLCIEPVLTGTDFYDRIKIAAELGFEAVEFWDPFGKDLSKIGRIASDNGIAISICCAKNPWENRVNGSAPKVLQNISESIKMIKEMGCDSLIVLSGDIDGKMDTQKNILIENLKRIGEIAVKENITVNIEALNSLVDHKGYYLDSSYLGFEIIKCVNSDNIRLLYEIYHMQIMEGKLIQNIKNNIGLIGHF